MSKVLKPDAAQIVEHMDGLASSLRLPSGQKYWPDWIYRSDRVENTAAILNSGRLLSRSKAESIGQIKIDAGSHAHINQLTPRHRNYVRLYFRPRTPTQYSNEGIRPSNKIKYSAHMPVPVYLLFSNRLLQETGVKFSRGRLAFDTPVGDSINFLQSIKFEDVYHDRSVGRFGDSSRQSHILNARHSEVLVENQLDLDHLKHIVCRSAPERDTLLNLLNPGVRSTWGPRVRVDEGRRRLFFKIGTFIQNVEFMESSTRFYFYTNIDHDMRGPFELKIEWNAEGNILSHSNPTFTVRTQPELFNLGRSFSNHSAKVTLDDNLACSHNFDGSQSAGIVF